jgi:hypothetical protein
MAFGTPKLKLKFSAIHRTCFYLRIWTAHLKNMRKNIFPKNPVDMTVLFTQTFLEKSLVPDALSGPECCGQVGMSALSVVGLSAIGQAGLSAVGEVGLSAPVEVRLSAVGQVGLSAPIEVGLSAVGEVGLSAPG